MMKFLIPKKTKARPLAESAAVCHPCGAIYRGLTTSGRYNAPSTIFKECSCGMHLGGWVQERCWLRRLWRPTLFCFVLGNVVGKVDVSYHIYPRQSAMNCRDTMKAHGPQLEVRHCSLCRKAAWSELDDPTESLQNFGKDTCCCITAWLSTRDW